MKTHETLEKRRRHYREQWSSALFNRTPMLELSPKEQRKKLMKAAEEYRSPFIWIEDVEGLVRLVTLILDGGICPCFLTEFPIRSPQENDFPKDAVTQGNATASYGANARLWPDAFKIMAAQAERCYNRVGPLQIPPMSADASPRERLLRIEKACLEGLSKLGREPVTLRVAIDKYIVSRSTLKRWIGEGGLKDYRRGEKGPHMVMLSQVACHCETRPPPKPKQ